MDPNATNGGRSPMEAGSPEFAEDRTQINSLNNKLILDQHLQLLMVAATRGQSHFDNLQAVSLRALNQSVELQANLNAKTLQSSEDTRVELETLRSQRARHADQWQYETAYDLGNPLSTGAGDTLRSAAYTPNRATDTASAGAAVSAEAVAAAVAKQVDATIAPVIAILQQIVSSLASTTASIANVLAQTQPKTAS